jgi:hypothetical protein
VADKSTNGRRSLWPRTFLYWLPLAVCVTILTGLVYVAVQQSYRQGADDPQIQMAEDAAIRLEDGANAQTVVGDSKVDMSYSLAPFMIVYDEAGHVVASSAQLNGATPDIPPGVFDSVRASGEDRLTWQPQERVRIAAVVTQFGGGLILAGRSLREVEERESRLTQIVFLAWAVGLVGSFLAWVIALGLANRLPLRQRG